MRESEPMAVIAWVVFAALVVILGTKLLGVW